MLSCASDTLFSMPIHLRAVMRAAKFKDKKVLSYS